MFTFVTSNFRIMNKRLQQFLNAENISQSQLADTLDVARAGVSHIIAGRNKPGFDFLESMTLHYPQLSMEWLLTGKGKMYKENSLFDNNYDTTPEIRNSQETSTPRSEPVKQARDVDHIVIFYSDNTFETFKPGAASV